MFKHVLYLALFLAALTGAYHYRVTHSGDAGFDENSRIFVENQTVVDSRVFSIAGRIDPFSRGGLLERYGARVRTRHDRPVSANSLAVFPFKGLVVLIYSNFDFPQRQADGVRLAVGAGQERLVLTAGVHFKNGTTMRFDNGDAQITPELFTRLESLQEERAQLISDATGTYELQIKGDGTVLGRSDEAFDLSGIDFAFAVFDTSGFEGEGDRSLRFDLGLWDFTRTNPGAGQENCKVNGRRDLGGKFDPKFLKTEEVYLLTETGDRRKAYVAENGTFAFKDIDCAQAAKVVSYNPRFNMEYYADDGRWFWVDEPENLTIRVRDPYEGRNEEELVPQKKDWGFKAARYPSPDWRLGPGKPNTLDYHIGVPGRAKYWDQNSFVNYYGFWDRDRFADNTNGCKRILIVGGSNITSVHMNTAEKFNVIAEEDLGVLLGGCVEIITAGQGTGHIGEYYEYIRDYGEILKPDLVLVETSNFQLLNIDPDFAQWMYGVDREHSRWAHFVKDADGRLVHKPKSRDFAKYLKPVREEPFDSCVPIKHSTDVPYSQMPEKIRNIWSFYDKILDHIEQETGLNIALYNINSATLGSRLETVGEEYCIDEQNSSIHYYGEAQFKRNLERFCRETGRDCLLTRIPLITRNAAERWLTWPNDMHMSWRGHQYVGHELARLLFLKFGQEKQVALKQSPEMKYLEFTTPEIKDEFAFRPDENGNFKLARQVTITALEDLIRLPKEERYEYLEELEDAYFSGYRAFLRKLRDKSDHQFCTMEQSGLDCWQEGHHLVLRYDVHINDLLGAFVLTRIHDDLKVPAVFYVMNINSPGYLGLQRYYESLSQHRSEYVRFAPHISPLCTYFTFIEDRSTQKNACANKKFVSQIFEKVGSGDGVSLAKRVHDGADMAWDFSAGQYEEYFGGFKSWSIHGSPYLKAALARAEKQDQILVRYPWLSPYYYAEHGRTSDPRTTAEHTVLSMKRDDSVLVRDDRGGPKIEQRIFEALSKYSTVGVLIHPYSFMNGRVDFSDYIGGESN